MRIIKLAFRNVLRNRRRSLLTMLGIVVSVLSILVLGGYYEYNYWGLRESYIRSQSAHIQIAVNGYWEKKEQAPFAYLIPRYKELIDLLEKENKIEMISPHLNFFAIIDTGSNLTELGIIRGVIPERENQVNTFFTKKLGKDLQSRDKFSVELGYSLAEKINVKIDDNIFLSMIDANNMQNSIPVDVKSIIGSYSADFDSRIVRIPLETAQMLAGVEGVQEIVVLLKETKDTKPFSLKIKDILVKNGWDDLVVTTWDEHSGYYGQVVQFYGGYLNIILFIVIVVAFFSTLNTMIMSISERITEVGTLRSFGTRRKNILTLFLCEGVLIGISGTLIGLVFTFILVKLIQFSGGIPMAPPPGLTTNVDVQILLTGKNIIIACLIGVVVPLFASLFPAVQVVRLQIIDLIRQEK